jgi:GNAT superfamily N-acetyltransferase
VVTVDHFYIRETHRGQGFGGKVLQELLTRWKAAGKPVEFSVLKGVRAMNFVTRLGGKVVGDEGLTERLRVL